MSRAGPVLSGICLYWLFAAPAIVFASQVAEGEKGFKSRCAICHGEDGTGNPSIARLMNVQFKPMSSNYVQKKPDEEILGIVLKGKGKMVPVRGLSEAQIRQIIAYIRTLAAKR